MNQLNNPLQAIIDAASKKAASSQIKDTLNRHQQKGNSSNKRYVLADISGSMSESVGSATKYDLLKKALGDPIIDWTAQQLIAFNSFPEPATPATLPQPSANTALHRAIEFIVPEKPAYTLVISDGQPDDEQAALNAADKLTGIIDVLFIGADNDYEAIAFLKKLAARNGGKMFIRDLQKTKSLPATALQRLLSR